MSTTVCVECSSEVPAASEFCPECGFFVHSGVTSCPECLRPVLLSLDACPECGFPLEELRRTLAASGEQEPGAAVLAKVAAAQREPAVVTSDSTNSPVSAVPPAGPAPDTVEREPHAGLEVVTRVLRAQMESFDEMTVVLGKLAESSDKGAIDALVASIRQFVDTAENTNNDMLSDLITNIGRFVDGSEKIKDDMLAGMTQQNLLTTGAMQEIVTSFSDEVKSAAAGMQEAKRAIQEAQEATLAELHLVGSLVKESAGRAANGSPYILYICAILAFFTILNFFVTAYVVRLVR